MDRETTIADLEAQVRTFCEARDWDQFHGPKDLAIALAAKMKSNAGRYPVENARGKNPTYGDL